MSFSKEKNYTTINTGGNISKYKIRYHDTVNQANHLCRWKISPNFGLRLTYESLLAASLVLNVPEISQNYNQESSSVIQELWI